LVFIQELGLLTRELLIISLVPVRFTSILITISYLIVVSHVVRNLLTWKLFARISALIFIIFPSPFIVISFGLKELLKKTKLHRTAIVLDFLIIINLLLLILPTVLSYTGFKSSDALYTMAFYSSIFNPLNTGFMNFIVPSLFSNKQIQILIALCFILVALLPLLITRKSFFLSKEQEQTNFIRKSKLTHLFIAIVFVASSRTGMQYQTQWSFNGVNVSTVDNYAEAQIWARDNTAKDSVFFIDGAMPPYYTWRTLSERPVSNPNPIWSFYNYPKYANEHNQRRELFWNSQLKIKTLAYAGQWNENYFCLSKNLMNISYVVQSTKQKTLTFPRAFVNEDFIVFKVVCK